MALESDAQAVLQARRLLGLPAPGNGRAWRVRRLDAQGGAYFIVHAADRVACVDGASGALLAAAASARAPVGMTSAAALTAAALGDLASIELVWKPCTATLSMFDPLWCVARGPQTVYIDQRGQRWPALLPAGPG